MKFNHYSLFLIFVLLLSGDICTNPGPQQNQNIEQQNNIWIPFKNRGMHILHININSLASKIDETRDIIRQSKPAVLGISESKLDGTISDCEVDIEGYSIIRLDRNRHGGGVVCYIREDICFNVRTCLSKEIEGIMFDIFLPKTRTITVGIFYRPPSQGNFLEILTYDLEKIDLKDRDIFFLGDFNINLFKNNKYIFDIKSNLKDDPHGPLLKNYKEFCSFFSLKQLIKEETRIANNTSSSLLDHVLTNSEANISQHGIIDIGISDHQMIFLTRKTNSLRFFCHKEKQCRSLKRYTAKGFRQLLHSLKFPNYETFNNIDAAYDDFFDKLLSIIDKIAPSKIV